MQSFDDLVAEFLAAEKVALYRPRWRTSQHPDYAEANLIIAVPGSRRLRARIVCAAHRVRLPPKYCFSVIFRGERVMGLDVNPGRGHRNLLNPSRVSCTHWQVWPQMEEAIPDDREQGFPLWFWEFLRRANVVTTFWSITPPRGVQLRFLDGE